MWGIPEVNHVVIFPHVINLALFDNGRTIRKEMVGRGGWGRNKGKMSSPKIDANDGPACQIIAGGKIS